MRRGIRMKWGLYKKHKLIGEYETYEEAEARWVNLSTRLNRDNVDKFGSWNPYRVEVIK
jgi:hypothetical protein